MEISANIIVIDSYLIPIQGPVLISKSWIQISGLLL